MVISYIVIQLIRKDDFQHFLLGGFFRNGGLIALICFAVIFSVICKLEQDGVQNFNKLFSWTSYGLIIFGFLELADLLPFKLNSSYQDSISLTLTNPNFASAFLGTFITVFIVSTVLKHRIFDVKNIFILIVTFYLLYKTQSLQGYMVIVGGILVAATAYRKNIVQYLTRYRKTVVGVIITIILFILLNFNFLLDWLISSGSVKQRLSYWTLSINIWLDHFWTGVGLENLRNYATIYRDLSLVKQEGMFTAPDRSHNVVLDHFVNGGVITGSIWLVFITSISFLAIRNLATFKNRDFSGEYLTVIIIWFSYLIQSLISVDHLALTLLGYISAGFIASENHSKEIEKSVLIRKKLKLFNKLSSIVLVFLFLFFLSYSLQILKYEYYAYQYLYKNNLSVLSEFYDSKAVVPQTLEDVTVKISQTKDFTTANKFALKLLIHRPNSHQAYYIKSVYYESIGNLPNARVEMLNALEIDKHNSVYLLGMSIYDFKLGDIGSAREFLRKTVEINPNQQGVDIVTRLINS
jgi:hypothetical protein